MSSPTTAPRLSPARDTSGSYQTRAPSHHDGLVRALRGAVVGGTLFTLVVTARGAGVLQGELAVGLMVLGCLLVPVSRQLSRRILIMGAVSLGWVPMAWWFPAALSSLGRIGVLLALVFGWLGAWVASGSSPRARLATLVPHLRLVDVLPLVSAVASAAALRELFAARTGARVLTLLIPGGDNVSHYAIVHMIRDSGVVTNPTPWTTSGETTPFTGYPQGFHAAVAATMELLTSPTVGSADHELVVYAHAVALVLIVAVTALVAGISALPRLRRSPAVAAPLVALVTAGFMAGPGATALQNGFSNFIVACALVGIVVLLIVPLQEVISPVILGAIGGAIVGIAYSWALLLVLVLLALPALVVPLSRKRWVASPGQWLVASTIMVAVSLSLGVVLDLLSAIPLANQLTALGGVTPPAIGMLITIVAGSSALTFVVLAQALQAQTGGTRKTALRSAALALIPLGGTVVAAAIAVLQLRATARISYYFWKFAIGLELACLVVIVAAVAAMVTARPQGLSTRLPRTLAAASSALLVLGASQSFGYIGPPLARYGVSQVEPTTQQRESALRVAVKPNPTGVRLLAALHVQERNRNRQVIFLPYPQDVRTNPILAEQWYLALTGTYTDRSTPVVTALKPMASPKSAAECATAILREGPNRLIVVGPDVLDRVRTATDPAFRGRIVGW